jgi:hypothetical protein
MNDNPDPNGVIVLRHGRRARHLRVAEPCTAEWDAMPPRQQGRFCAACNKTVTDVARMTEREVDAWLVTAGDRVCIRMRVDASGRPLFARKWGGSAHPMAGLMTAATLAACSVPPAGDIVSNAPRASVPARPPKVQVPVIQPEDPRKHTSPQCIPDEKAAPLPAESREYDYVAGGMEPPPQGPSMAPAIIDFLVDRAESVRFDGMLLSPDEVRNGTKRTVKARTHFVSYALDGITKTELIRFGSGERATVRLP